MIMLSQMQTYKGWFFFLTTAIPLYFLISAHQRFVLESAQLLKATEKKYEHLFLSNPHSNCVIDPATLGFILMNRKFIQPFGYSVRELNKHTIHQIISEKDHAKLAKVVNSTLSTGEQEESVILRGELKNGSIISIELMIYMIRLQGQVSLLCQIRDVTAELLNREQVRELH